VTAESLDERSARRYNFPVPGAAASHRCDWSV